MTNQQLFKMYHDTGKIVSQIREEIMARNLGWRVLMENGMQVNAIVVYRNENPSLSISEAKKFMDNELIEYKVKLHMWANLK
jgi:uroporphyrinogen-III synthase